MYYYSNHFFFSPRFYLCNVVFRHKIEFALDANNKHQKSYLHWNYLICLYTNNEQYKCFEWEFNCLNIYQLPTINSICARLICLFIDFVICFRFWVLHKFCNSNIWCSVSIRSILDTEYVYVLYWKSRAVGKYG